MPFSQKIQAALSEYEKKKSGLHVRLFGEPSAIRALRALPDAERGMPSRLLRCFVSNIPTFQKQASHRVMQAVAESIPLSIERFPAWVSVYDQFVKHSIWDERCVDLFKKLDALNSSGECLCRFLHAVLCEFVRGADQDAAAIESFYRVLADVRCLDAFVGFYQKVSLEILTDAFGSQKQSISPQTTWGRIFKALKDFDLYCPEVLVQMSNHHFLKAGHYLLELRQAKWQPSPADLAVMKENFVGTLLEKQASSLIAAGRTKPSKA